MQKLPKNTVIMLYNGYESFKLLNKVVFDESL